MSPPRISLFIIQNRPHQWMNQHRYTLRKDVPDETHKEAVGFRMNRLRKSPFGPFF